MSVVATLMRYYPVVFHPITVLGAGVIVLVRHEWARQGLDRSRLWRRIGGFLGMGLLAIVPTAAYMLVTGAGPTETMSGNAWQVDALVASGIVIAAVGTWWLWNRFGWGPLVPPAMEALLVVTVVYGGLSPVWNVSGHVVIALVPALYLTLVDRRYWPALAVPVVMVPNRVYLGAHTWAQSIVGLALAAVVVTGVYWYRNGGSLSPASASTAT